jgi:hypothetical protein
MKTLLRFGWPVALTAVLEYGIVRFARSGAGAAIGIHLKPLHWWAIWLSLAVVAGLQYWAYRADRTFRRELFERYTAAADAKGVSTDDPPQE